MPRRAVANLRQDEAIASSWFWPKIVFSEEKCHGKYLKEHFWALRFQNFLGRRAHRPLSGLHLRRSKLVSSFSEVWLRTCLWRRKHVLWMFKHSEQSKIENRIGQNEVQEKVLRTEWWKSKKALTRERAEKWNKPTAKLAAKTDPSAISNNSKRGYEFTHNISSEFLSVLLFCNEVISFIYGLFLHNHRCRCPNRHETGNVFRLQNMLVGVIGVPVLSKEWLAKE